MSKRMQDSNGGGRDKQAMVLQTPHKLFIQNTSLESDSVYHTSQDNLYDATVFNRVICSQRDQNIVAVVPKEEDLIQEISIGVFWELVCALLCSASGSSLRC